MPLGWDGGQAERVGRSWSCRRLFEPLGFGSLLPFGQPRASEAAHGF
jgi:hypothetical protein